MRRSVKQNSSGFHLTVCSSRQPGAEVRCGVGINNIQELKQTPLAYWIELGGQDFQGGHVCLFQWIF